MRTSVFVAFIVIGVVSQSAAQSWQPPSDSQRCPSKWGKGDQRGSGNHMKPETVLRAARLIKTGEVFELGRVLSESMPLSAGRRFEILTKRTRNDPGTNHRGSNEELVVAEIGQVGTQFDTFSHQMIGSTMYNCFTLEETATRSGFSKLGVEQVGALITRGVLIDVASLKHVPVLAENYEVTPTDGSAWLQGDDPNYRIIRGGSWRNESEHVRAAARFKRNVNVRFDTLGFRVARTMQP